MKFLSFSKTKRRHEEKYIDVFLSRKKSISPQNKCFWDFQQWKKTIFIETFLGNKSKLISTNKQKSKKIRNWKKVSFSLPHKTWVCCTMRRAFFQERGGGIGTEFSLGRTSELLTVNSALIVCFELACGGRHAARVIFAWGRPSSS